MNRLLTALALGLLVSLVPAAAATGAPGSGGGNMDSASGSVNFFGVQDTFSAKSSSIGTDAQGQWKATATSSDPNATLTGDIRCLRVATITGVGAVFEARGVIVDVRNAQGFIDQGFILRGSDSGKFSHEPDTYDRFTTFEPQLEGSCVAPTAGFFQVQDGEIVVKDAF
jgi:hypothetical protein